MYYQSTKQKQTFYNDVVNLNLHGVHFQHINICDTRFLLHYYRIDNGQKNDLLKRGKIIHDNIYNRENEPLLLGLKPDRVNWEKKQIIEYKNSNSCFNATISQVMFYVFIMNYITNDNLWSAKIYTMQNKKTSEIIEQTNDTEQKLFYNLEKMKQLISQNNFAKPKKIPICKGCSFSKICWLNIKED